MEVRIAIDNECTGELVEVDQVDLQGVRPLRVGTRLVANVERTCADERAWVADYPYSATWHGWHYGQVPGYGATPADAVRALCRGDVA